MPSKTSYYPPMTSSVPPGHPSRQIHQHHTLYSDPKSTLEHPAAVHHYRSRPQTQPHLSPVLYIPSPRQHGSVSSDGTVSSASSISKINRLSPAAPYYMASHVEQGQGHMNIPGSQSSRPPQSMSDYSARRTSPPSTSIITQDHDHHNSAIYHHHYIQDHEARVGGNDDHAISVLAFLSTLDPIYSLAMALYSVLIGMVFLLCAPISLCKRTFSPGRDVVVSALAPWVRRHLRLIHATSVDDDDDEQDVAFSPAKLLLLHAAITPLVSVGVAMAAWVAACFWLFALMMGNPDGTERGDDGRATVLRLRDWWASVLMGSATTRQRRRSSRRGSGNRATGRQ